MHQIITAIEEGNFELFSSVLEKEPESINQKDHENWSLLNLSIAYELPEFTEFLLNKMTSEQIKQETPKHPFIVCLEQNEKILPSLINSNKFDLNTKLSAGDNLINILIIENKLELLKLLLEKGVSPFEKNNNGFSGVDFAVRGNNTEIFNTIFNLDNFSEFYNEDLLIQAIKNNNQEIFSKLIEYTDLDGDELFGVASDFNNIEAVNHIFEHVSFIPGKQQLTRLIELICEKYENESQTQASLNLIDYLLKIKISFSDFVTSDGQTAWMLAINNDNEKIFEKIIQAKGDLNADDQYNNTPLMYAIQKNNTNFVKSILKKKINLTHKDLNGNTALSLAVAKGNLEMVQEILKYPNVLINEKNNNEQTALSIAIYKKRLDLISELLWNGADVSYNPAKLIEDNSFYQIGLSGQYEKAYESYDENIIDSFISLKRLGLNLFQINENGDSFILHFIKEGYIDNFKSVLKCPFNPNQPDRNGDTALMCAMRKNNDEYAVGLLLRCDNIDHSVKNNNNEDIYDITKKYGTAPRVHLLIKDDKNINLEKLSKIFNILIKNGKLEEEIDNLNQIKKFDLSKYLKSYTDDNKNNALMVSVLYENYENFQWLLKNTKTLNIKEKNSEGKNITDLIKNLPEEEQEKYLNELEIFFKKIPNKNII